MKKAMRLFMSTVLTLVLLSGMQTIVFATVDVSDESGLEGSRLEETVQPRNEVSGESMLAEINPISENNDVPNTGVVNLAIPGMVALLAAGTAAAALIGKKK